MYSDEPYGLDWNPTKVSETDPIKFQLMHENQMIAFLDFQAIVPDCKLHGSTVYGLCSPDSDVNICVANIDTVFLFFNGNYPTPFFLVDDQREPRISRII